MGFSWFSKTSASADDKALARAQKLQSRERWAEALNLYEEILARTRGSNSALEGVKTCRENLVARNLEEAQSYREIDPERAREHARLALDLAGDDEKLKERADEVAEVLLRGSPPQPSPVVISQPLFGSSCSCATPCLSTADAEENGGEFDTEELLAFYLDSCEPAVREAFQRLAGSFPIGFVHLQRGELEDAQAHLERAAEEYAAEPGPTYALGLLASISGKDDAAAIYFEKTLALDGEFGPAVRHLAETLREMGNRSGAIDVLSRWLLSHPEDAEAHLLLALSRIESGEIETGLEHALTAQRLTEESDFRPSLIVAKAQQILGDDPAAASTLQRVLSRKPDLIEALVELAEILIRQGGNQAERAAEVFKRCYRQDPDRGWWYLVRIAEAYQARGWREQATDVLNRAREELPEEASAHTTWEEALRRLTVGG